MARRFVAASTQYLSGSPPVTGYPLTLSCWANPSSVALAAILGVGNIASNTLYFELFLGNTGTASFRVVNGGTTAAAIASGNYSANHWSHFCGVGTSSTDRAMYLDGAFKVTSTTDVSAPAGIDTARLGRRVSSTPSQHYGGLLADAAIWSAALTDAEVRQLAQGVSPLLVRPQSLAAYWPLHTPGTVQEFDLHPWKPRRYDLTVNGATPAEHPAFLAPPSPRRVLYAATAGSAGATYAAPARVSISCGIRIG